MLALVDLIYCPFFEKYRGNYMKKLLVVSAIAALGLTSVAFAGGLPEEMPVAPAAVASSDTGIYLGLQGGWGFTNWKNAPDLNVNENVSHLHSRASILAHGSVSTNVSKDNGFVGRVFAGYDINRYFAVEAGYSRFFNKANYNVDYAYAYAVSIADVDFGSDSGSGSLGLTNIKTQAVDAYFKGKLPVVDNFDLYAKLGAGWLFVNADQGNTNNINVAFGAGADYYITPNVIANLEWTRIAGHTKLGKNYIPSTDAFMVGLRYKFDL